jgi:hypothetical protein
LRSGARVHAAGGYLFRLGADGETCRTSAIPPSRPGGIEEHAGGGGAAGTALHGAAGDEVQAVLGGHGAAGAHERAVERHRDCVAMRGALVPGQVIEELG